MIDIVLNEKGLMPDEALLKPTLIEAYTFFEKLEGMIKEFSHEWKFYNKKSGWIYKVFNKKKSLFYITPLRNNFNIGFAIRENEREALLQSDIEEDIKINCNRLKNIRRVTR